MPLSSAAAPAAAPAAAKLTRLHWVRGRWPAMLHLCAACSSIGRELGRVSIEDRAFVAAACDGPLCTAGLTYEQPGSLRLWSGWTSSGKSLP